MRAIYAATANKIPPSVERTRPFGRVGCAVSLTPHQSCRKNSRALERTASILQQQGARGGGTRAICYAEIAQQRGDVNLDRAFAEQKFLGDLLVRVTFHQQREHFALTRAYRHQATACVAVTHCQADAERFFRG